MKPSKHLRLLRYLEKARVFSIKDVVRVTDSNNPYRTIEHLKEQAHLKLDTLDVIKDKAFAHADGAKLVCEVRFRLYHLPRERQVAVDLAKRKGWRIAA